MTESLEELAHRHTQPADAVAGRFQPTGEAPRRTQAEIDAIHADLHFGTIFTDHMAHTTWTPELGWHDHRLEPYGPLQLAPSAAVLHYSQEIFEGLKAYRHPDGSVWTFRPGYNAVRMNASARRMAMPEIEPADFLASLVDVVRADAAYVPSLPGSALYLRPFMFASEEFLGVRASHRYEFMTIASPVGPLFNASFSPVAIWVVRDYHRACPGGTGEAKTGGNYAAAVMPQRLAAEKGYDQVCFLDARTGKNIEELGGMNVFAVLDDGSIITPRLTGTILQGGTRASILRLAADLGHPVREEDIPLQRLVDGARCGEVKELFACGTAAVISAIGRLASDDFEVEFELGDVTQKLFHQLTGIQTGVVEDPYGWMYRIV